MKRRAIVAVVLMANGICQGFDAEKYARESHGLFSFIEDVNEAKTEILEGKFGGSYRRGHSANTAGQIFRNMSLRPPHEKIRIGVEIAPVLLSDAIPPMKSQVLAEMLRKSSSRLCETYGIDVLDANDPSVPLLLTDMSIRDWQAGDQFVYSMHTSLGLGELLVDPTSQAEIIAYTWRRSYPHMFTSDRHLEKNILEAVVGIDDFLFEQYQRCVNREAVKQLEKEGRLPPWLKTGLVTTKNRAVELTKQWTSSQDGRRD